jgi:hypothetical protein
VATCSRYLCSNFTLRLKPNSTNLSGQTDDECCELYNFGDTC